MRTKTKQIAMGGIAVALTFVLCWLGSVSASGKLLAPAISGLLLMLIARYVSGGAAVAVYAASSLILFLLPDKLSTFTYILLFGYYPLLCGVLRKLPLLLRLLLKALILTAFGCIAMFGGAALLGLWENEQFVRWYPVMILVYYIFAAVYDAFIALLRYHIENRWDARLRKLLG